MKALEDMTNLERAYHLAKLFPHSLMELTTFIGKEIELFKSNRELVYNAWTEDIITVSFWYQVMGNIERVLSKNDSKLCRYARRFSDQLFDGYDAFFSINALIHYTEKEECGRKLAFAIHLLFGEQKLVQILKPESCTHQSSNTGNFKPKNQKK
ncbi:MAG: hypothetical protein LBF27_06160 [Sphingobacterium sp.]|jgi:hypothetical protein|nr:hypothetical protein [Sphingobacterium sp.]